MKAEEIISDSELDKVHANAKFGTMTKRDVVKYGVLKCASGYHQGHTSKTICIEHGLIYESDYKLTPKGQEYLWASWATENF